MKILVCIKQVPSTSQVEIDAETGVIKREGTKGKINPYDLFALEQAFTLREACGGEVDVITMGPMQAKSALLEALHMGADRACLLSDRRFAGSDVLATSYALASGVKKFGKYDLILCGKQTTDGDTAQVGPELAEFLGIDHSCYVQSVKLEKDFAEVLANYGDYSQLERIKLPCLLTVEKDVNTPRLPSYLRSTRMGEDNITVFGLDDFEDKNKDNYGLSGSPTQVERIFPPERVSEQEIIEGSAKEISKRLFDILAKEKYL